MFAFLSVLLSFLLLFMLLEFHRWSDLRRWWLCKTQFKWMQACHNENGTKGMHTQKNASYSFMAWKSCRGGRKVRLGLYYYKSRKIIFLCMARMNALFNKREQKYTLKAKKCKLEATGPAQIKLSTMKTNYSPHKVHQIARGHHHVTWFPQIS